MVAKLKKVQNQKLLCIVINGHLSWAPHIDYLCSTISSKISLLRHNSIYIPQNIQKIFYQSYIQPLLDYGCNTWGNTTAANIERLSKLQKRAARIILRADFMTPSIDLNGFPYLNAYSLISRTDKVELISTEFFQQSCNCLGYLEQHTKSCKSYHVGKYIFFRLKNDHFYA